MDFYRFINKNIVNPLYYFKNGDKRLKRLEVLEKNQYLPTPLLDELALENIKGIVRHAYETTKFYRERLDCLGIKPEDINSLADVVNLPVVTKKDIQENCNDMISNKFDISELIKDASGGSTGEPTIFYRDRESSNNRAADQIRHDKWSGWDLGDRFALVWGAKRDLRAALSFREHIISRYIARIWELDAFEMTEEKMSKYVNTLEKVQPRMILGYANALAMFSEFLLTKFPEHKIRPRGIISSAETLTMENRELIEKAFSCKVLNRYGSREVGLIASECTEQNGLHLNHDNVYLEVVSNGAPAKVGEVGDILVTDYSNVGMPLIRYNMGDVGKLSNQVCSCGRTLRLLESVEGRSGDFFKSKHGTMVHGEYFTHLFYGVEEVEKFQIIQESLERITLKLVASNHDRDSKYIKYITDKTQEILESKYDFDIVFLEEIPPTASGKYLFTISRV